MFPPFSLAARAYPKGEQREIAMTQNIAAHAERIAKHYWGEPNKKLSKKGLLRWGNAGSKELDIQRGVYFDFEENHGGGVVELAVAIFLTKGPPLLLMQMATHISQVITMKRQTLDR